MNEVIAMNEIKSWTQSMSQLVEVVADLTDQINSYNNYDKIDIDLESLDKLTVIIKRMGDTVITDVNAEPIQEPTIKEVRKKNVNKSKNK
jgi:hypothetical protein